jgi:Protein of unknown function (DUF3800)
VPKEENERIIGRTHHYLVSVLGSRRRHVNPVFFTLFMDESGARPTHKIAVAAGLVIPSSRIIALEKEWETFKEKEGFNDFHASQCNAADGKFSGWDDDKINRVFFRVRQICKKYGVGAISASVKKEYFDEVVPHEYRRYVYEHHYSWCVSYVIALAEIWRCQGRRNPFHFIFDWLDVGSPERIELEKVMKYSERASRENGMEGVYEKYGFDRRRESPGLQCVDDIAWVTNRYALYRYHGEDLPLRANFGWQCYGGDLGPDGWLRAFAFRKEALKKHVEDTFRDGRTLERFERWKKEDEEERLRIQQFLQGNDGPATSGAPLKEPQCNIWDRVQLVKGAVASASLHSGPVRFMRRWQA